MKNCEALSAQSNEAQESKAHELNAYSYLWRQLAYMATAIAPITDYSALISEAIAGVNSLSFETPPIPWGSGQNINAWASAAGLDISEIADSPIAVDNILQVSNSNPFYGSYAAGFNGFDIRTTNYLSFGIGTNVAVMFDPLSIPYYGYRIIGPFSGLFRFDFEATVVGLGNVALTSVVAQRCRVTPTTFDAGALPQACVTLAHGNPDTLDGTNCTLRPNPSIPVPFIDFGMENTGPFSPVANRAFSGLIPWLMTAYAGRVCSSGFVPHLFIP